MKRAYRVGAVRVSATLILVLAAVGCSTPQLSYRTPIVDLDQQDSLTGLGSPEIRQVAGELMPRILALPEIADAEEPVRIALARVRNSTSHPMDMDIFGRKMRAELMRNANGQVRFYADDDGNPNATRRRTKVMAQRLERQRDKAIEEVARQICALPIFLQSGDPKTIAVLPAPNCNLVNLNGDSFVAQLRGKVGEYAAGRIGITMPGETEGADYYLTGQFVADSVKQEGMVNLVDYIALMEERLRKEEPTETPTVAGGTLQISDSAVINSVVTGGVTVNLPPARRKALLDEIERSVALRVTPDVGLSLNVMLVDAKRRVSCFEKTIDVVKKTDDGTGNADYILTSEISSVSKRSGGTELTYYLFAFQLLEPESNEYVWEDTVELKKKTSGGVAY